MNKSEESKGKEEKKEKQPTGTIDRVYGSIPKFRIALVIPVVLIAILLMFIGATITSTSESGAYKSGAVIYNFGVMILAATLFLGALTNEELDSNTKMGLILAAGIILAIGFITSGVSLW